LPAESCSQISVADTGADLSDIPEICRSIKADALRQIEEDWILDLSEFDEESEGRAKYYGSMRFVIKSEKIFWDIFWISHINRGLISIILDKSESPWRMIAFAEHIPETLYPKLITKISEYCNGNLMKIFRSHAECMFMANGLNHLSAHPRAWWLLMDIIRILPPILAYQLLSWVHQTFDDTTTEALAIRAKSFFKEMLPKQKCRYALSVVGNNLHRSIFTEFSEINEIWILLSDRLSDKSNRITKQERNEAILALMTLAKDNAGLIGYLPVKELKIWELLTSGFNFPSIIPEKDTPQNHIDFWESKNLLSWRPFLMKMVFPNDEDGKKSYKRFMKMIKNTWIPSQYQEWEVSISNSKIRIIANDPNYLAWEAFLSWEWYITETEHVDIAVVRWHTQHISAFADELFKMRPKLFLFWGCQWIMTLKEIISNRVYRMDENVFSISDSICIAPVRIWRSKINDQIILNIIEQFDSWAISLDLNSILKESDWEYQSFSLAINPAIREIIRKFNS